jgi:hypothetical protein
VGFLKVIKYTDDKTWGRTLYYLAEEVKKEVEQAIQLAQSTKEEEELEDILGGNIGCCYPICRG